KGFDAFNTSRFDTGPFSHALTYGGDGVHDFVRNDDAAGGFGTALTPSGKRQLAGAFVQDEARYGNFLRVVAAARYDSFQLDSPRAHADGERVSPKATIGLTPLPGIEF